MSNCWFKIFLMGLFAVACLGLSSGDYSPIENSTVYTDNKITLNFFIDNTTNNITIYMKFNAYGYFCLEFASRMANGDYNNVEVASGAVELLDQYSPGGHDEPEEDPTQNLQLLGYDTDESSYVTVKYTRALDTGDSKDKTLQYGQKYSFSYAWRAGSLVMARHRDGQYRVFSVTLDNNSNNNNNNDDNNYDDGLNHMDGEEIVHGVLLSIIWMLLVDLGIWLKYLYKWKYRIWVHGALMLLCMGGTIALTVILIAKNKPKLSELGSDTRAHYVIGIMVLAWVCAQCLLGFILQVLLCFKNVPTWFITILRRSHSYSGVILIVLGKVDVILGWAMKSKGVGLGVSCGIGGAIWAAISLYIGLTSGSIARQAFEPRKVSKYNDRWVKKFTNQGAKVPVVDPVMAIMNKPYPWAEVQQANFFIFDDLVYRIPNYWFHPGGLKAIELTKGRQVDRFMYGMFHLEQYPKLLPYEHPKQSLQTVYQPLGYLQPNPICELQTKLFAVQEMINIAQDAEIFYFHPLQGSAILRRPTNLRHVGQYFTVRAFQHTRLYTCVLCQCKANRRLRSQILQAIMPNERRINTILLNGRVIHQKSMFNPNGNMPTSTTINGFVNPNFEGIPMIIKKYNKLHAFTRHLFDYPGTPVEIEGLKGRGMCFDAIPDGNIVMIGGGTGIYPYLDLIDAIFKVIIGARTGLVPADEISAYSRALANKTFNFFFSVEKAQELVMPDQMNLINQARTPLANIWVRAKDLGNAFQGRRIKGKFERQFVSQMIAKLPNLRMVYICGPQSMYKSITEYLQAAGITQERIYYV